MRRAAPLVLCVLTVSCTSARLAKQQTVAVATEPARQWKQVAAATAVVGATMLLDDELAELGRRNDLPFSEEVEPFGGGHSDKVIAGFLLYGIAGKNDRARAVAFDSIVATTIAAKGITPLVKQLTDRRRPNGRDDPAFPSGHATQAFTVAAVIATHYEQRWVRWLAYGLASTVAIARVDHEAHWASDVVAGAAIGTFVGRTAARTGRAERVKWTLVPVRKGVAVSVVW